MRLPCSSEGLEVAQAIQYQLRNDAEVVLWNEGVFALSHGYLETLLNTVKQFDYGVFVLRSDDTLVSRGSESGTTRGNVLFELGMFYGHLGRSRTFAVYDSTARPGVISDLHGVSFAPYDGSRTSDIVSAVGPACFSIRQELKNWGPRAAARKLLLLCANPEDTGRLRTDVEVRNICAALQAARRSGEIVIEQEWAVQANDLDRILLIHRPTMLHVSCSGNAQVGLLFEDAEGKAKPVSHSAFRALLRPITDTLQCVVFSSCGTNALASSLAVDVECTIGVDDITDKAAIAFTSGFYTAIGNSSDYKTAYKYGVAKLSIDHSDSESFKMYPNRETA
jgi:hypothetical protein